MKTFDEIMTAMLENVPDELDKREGGVIYTALAPCAYVLYEQYIDLETILQLVFASSSLGEFLERRTSEMGITRIGATMAIRKGIFTDSQGASFNVTIGSKFGADGLIYSVINKISEGIFALECETAGMIGNTPSGALLPIDNYFSGLSSAVLSDIITPGTDDETDTKLLERYHLKVREPTTSGNAYHYKAWALEVAGVGKVRIFPLWNGNGTVKVVLADNEGQPVTQTVVDDVSSHIEEVRPIGATVTVVSGVAKIINVSAELALMDGFELENVQPVLVAALTDLLKGVVFNASFISLAKVGLTILSITGVLDYSNLQINHLAGNAILDQEDIPILGGADFGLIE